MPPIFIRQPYVDSLADEAIGFLNSLGLYYDDWQTLTIREMMGVKSDGTWASPDFGLVVGRQNGKSEVAIARILIGLFLIKEPLIVYSAHLADTASEIFLRLVSILGDKDDAHNPNLWIHQYVKHVWFANGKQGIELKDGCRLKIKTRTGGGGRGFTANCLILDEAMVLSHAFIAALGPTQSAIANPQTIAMGSAGNQDSEYFGHLRAQAFVENAVDISWLEWSAQLCGDYCETDCTDHDDVYSPETYAKTNPAYGTRITFRAVEKDRRNLDYTGFIIERLSVGDWPLEIDEFHVITREAWDGANGAERGYGTVGRVVFAVTTSPDRLSTAITVAGFTDEERSNVLVQLAGAEEIDMRAGTKWVIPRIKQLFKDHKPYAIVIDGKGQAATMIEPLIEAGVKVISPQALEYAQSAARFAVAVTGTKHEPRYLYHYDQPEMTMAVAAADKRPLAGLWAWARSTEASNIIALESATLAFWGLEREATEASARRVWVV